MRIIAALVVISVMSCDSRSLPYAADHSDLVCPQGIFDQMLSPPICEYGMRYSDRSLEVVGDLCSHLPVGAGACSAACDRDRLDAFLPSVGCRMFGCETTDGLFFFTGGCAP